jgi:hypothetical protein
MTFAVVLGPCWWDCITRVRQQQQLLLLRLLDLAVEIVNAILDLIVFNSLCLCYR